MHKTLHKMTIRLADNTVLHGPNQRLFFSFFTFFSHPLHTGKNHRKSDPKATKKRNRFWTRGPLLLFGRFWAQGPVTCFCPKSKPIRAVFQGRVRGETETESENFMVVLIMTDNYDKSCWTCPTIIEREDTRKL
jgi:hypothetical protein